MGAGIPSGAGGWVGFCLGIWIFARYNKAELKKLVGAGEGMEADGDDGMGLFGSGDGEAGAGAVEEAEGGRKERC